MSLPPSRHLTPPYARDFALPLAHARDSVGLRREGGR